MTDMYESWRGYVIYKEHNGRNIYMKSCYNGEYKWVADYLYAKHIKTKRIAEQHLERIRGE